MGEPKESVNSQVLEGISNALRHPAFQNVVCPFLAGAFGALISGGIRTAFEQIVVGMDEFFFTIYPGPYFVFTVLAIVAGCWILVWRRGLVWVGVASALIIAGGLWAYCFLLHADIFVDDVYWRFGASFTALTLVASGAAVASLTVIVPNLVELTRRLLSR